MHNATSATGVTPQSFFQVISSKAQEAASSSVASVMEFVYFEEDTLFQPLDLSPDIERECLNALLHQALELGPQGELENMIGQINSAPTPTQAIATTVNLLIEAGVSPARLEVYFSNAGVQLPRSAFLDWKILNELGQKSMMGSLSANLRAVYKIKFQWFANNWPVILGAFCIARMVSTAITPAAAAECHAPQGSYSDSCTVLRESSYRSSDPVFHDVEFCRFEIECKKMTTGVHMNKKILPEEDVGCIAKID